jgi:hypothetical protein
MTPITSQSVPASADTDASDLNYILGRLEACCRLIRGIPDKTEERRALIKILGQEFCGLLSRIWGCAR